MAMKKVHNYGQSVKAKLLNIARKERQQYQLLLTRYLQERFLYRLSISQHRKHFLLKGGALLYAHEQFYARPTLDIDFMGSCINNDRESVQLVMKEICEITYEQDGVIFLSETLQISDITVENKYPGIRITLTATLDSVRQDMTMDIGFGDVITPCPAELDYPMLIDGFPETSLMAYSLETVVAEKFQTMVVRATSNSRMKDFYDLYIILKNHQFNVSILQEAIQATFANRQTEYDPDNIVFTNTFCTNNELSTRWITFMKKLKINTPLTFIEVMDYIQKQLKPYWENLAGNETD